MLCRMTMSVSRSDSVRSAASCDRGNPRLSLLVIIALVLLGSGPLLSAEQREPLQPLEAHLRISVIAAPLSPSLSTISFELPFRVLPLARPWSRAGASFWILSDSPYLVPRSYLELGVLLDWAFIDTSRQALLAGLGTAVGVETSQHSMSVPLIFRAEYRFAVLRWLALEATAQALLFGLGAGFVVHLEAVSRPFALGLTLGIGVGYGFLSEWDFNPHGDALQLDVSVGYSWPRIGRARE
jgi:hypothetical protein